MNLTKTLKNSALAVIIFGAFANVGIAQSPVISKQFHETGIVLKREMVCLAQVIHDEARGEPKAGKIAVANVVINRTATWKRDVCGVVYHKRGKVCQFSGMCSRGEKPYTKESINLAYEVMHGQHKDLTKGATYFHAKYVNPAWNTAFQKTKTIGNHIFYRSNQTL